MMTTILVTVIVIVFIGLGLLFIHYGYDIHFIHDLPKAHRLTHNDYDSLLSLYQTRIDLVNWGIACIGALLTFLAFYVQYQYNNRQKEDLARERFENNMFHLLDVYRHIYSQTSIDNAGSGKTAFHYMFYEYKAIYRIISQSPHIRQEINNIDKEVLNYIAFTYFINGVSSNKIDTSIKEEVLSAKGKHLIRKTLLTKQRHSENYGPEYKHKDSVEYLLDYRHKNIKYFDGHRSRLIPYIKYVSLILNFLVSQKLAREEDVKYLISEQTDHEIALIYAYKGYLKYKQKSDGKEENESKKMTTLYQTMYSSLPEDMAYKFLYDSDNFIS